MKSFKDLKLELIEASPLKPQDTTAQKVNAAVSALKLRQQGVNPSMVTSAQRKLNSLSSKGLTPSQMYQRLGTNVKNQYFQFGNEVPTGLLDPSINPAAFRQILQKLKTTKQQISQAQQSAERMAASAQQKAAAKQQMQEASEEFNPPAALTIKRIGIRNFPDGRRVALYSNQQLGLVFSIPYAGKGQTPGEIIPTVQVQAQATNEEIEELSESAASFIAHMKAAMKAKDDEIRQRNLLKAKDARLSMTNAEITKYKDLLDQHRQMMSEEIEELDEAESVFTSFMKDPKATLSKHYGEKSTKNLQSIASTGKGQTVRRIAGMLFKDRTANALSDVFDKRYDKGEISAAKKELKNRGIEK